MADQLKSNRKRTLTSKQAAPVAKRQKRDKCGQSAINDEAEGPISNICNELIDQIFDFLDTQSLLNMADTCKRFQMAATAKFGQDSSTKEVHFIQDKQKPDGITVNNPAINVVGLRYSLRFLRCFGTKVSIVHVINNNKAANKGDKHMDRYINQYCAESLTMLHYRHRVFSVDSFPKPFERVTTLYIQDSDVGKKFPNFPKLFPNLTYLNLHELNKFVGLNNAAVFFPHLRRLDARIVEKPGHFNSKCLTKLLLANLQLEIISIDLYQQEKDLGQLLRMLSKNSSLSKLTICGKVNGVNKTHVAFDLFRQQHPSFKELGFGSLTTVHDALFLRRHLYFLQSLSFRLGHSYECDLLLSRLGEHWQHKTTNNYNYHEIVLSH